MMKTKKFVLGLLVAVLVAANVAHGSSSVNGAPGRSDFNKRKKSQTAKVPRMVSPIVQPAMSPETPIQKETVKAVEPAASPSEKQVAQVAEPSPVAGRTLAEKVAAAADQKSLQSSGKTEEMPAPPVISPEEKTIGPAVNPAVAVLPYVPEAVPAAPSTVVEEKKKTPVRTISYADVLNDRQKSVLKARAEDLNVAENDYDTLLSADERERLDALVRERMAAMASGE